jgi:hypothetical protein
LRDYSQWALDIAKVNPNFSSAFFTPQTPDYNYDLSFRSGDFVGGNSHLSDIGKMVRHPTFSNESAQSMFYPEYAGRWVEPMTPQGQWLYHNPARGLFMAPEQAAYNPDTFLPDSAFNRFHPMGPTGINALFAQP